MAGEEREVADELVLPGEGGAAGADPAVVAAVLLVRAEVGEHGEVLAVAAVADVHLGAVAALVVVLGADHRLERLELGVLPVPPAALVRARVVRLDAGRRRLIVEADAASRPAALAGFASAALLLYSSPCARMRMHRLAARLNPLPHTWQ